MIVVDANILAYSILDDPYAEFAQGVRFADPEWMMPRLWIYEFENILATLIRSGSWTPTRALEAVDRAGMLLTQARNPSRNSVFELIQRHKIKAYNAHYVALAQELAVPLVTQDKELLRKLPETAVSMVGFLDRHGRPGIQERTVPYRARVKKPRR